MVKEVHEKRAHVRRRILFEGVLASVLPQKYKKCGIQRSPGKVDRRKLPIPERGRHKNILLLPVLNPGVIEWILFASA